MTVSIATLVEAVKAHAVAHYNEGGWDVIVETFSDEEIAEQIKGTRSIKGALARFDTQISVWSERQNDADSYREPVVVDEIADDATMEKFANDFAETARVNASLVQRGEQWRAANEANDAADVKIAHLLVEKPARKPRAVKSVAVVHPVVADLEARELLTVVDEAIEKLAVEESAKPARKRAAKSVAVVEPVAVERKIVERPRSRSERRISRTIGTPLRKFVESIDDSGDATLVTFVAEIEMSDAELVVEALSSRRYVTKLAVRSLRGERVAKSVSVTLPAAEIVAAAPAVVVEKPAATNVTTLASKRARKS